MADVLQVIIWCLLWFSDTLLKDYGFCSIPCFFKAQVNHICELVELNPLGLTLFSEHITLWTKSSWILDFAKLLAAVWNSPALNSELWNLFGGEKAAHTHSWELFICFSSQLCIQGKHFGSLKLATVKVFTPQILANTKIRVWLLFSPR